MGYACITTHAAHALYALDRHRPLFLETLRIPLVALLLAVLEAGALMVLQQAVLPAKVTGAEAAVADDALRRVLARLEAASNLLGRHTTTQREGHVQRRVGCDGVVGECVGSVREVLAGVHEAQVRGAI